MNMEIKTKASLGNNIEIWEEIGIGTEDRD